MKGKIKLYALTILGGLLGLANFVAAQSASDPEQLPLVRMLREFSVFLNVILLIFVIVLAISLHGALKYLGGKGSLKSKLKLIYRFLSKEPAQLFSQLAQKDKNGTYIMPFESYRRLHNISQKTFIRTMGLLVIQVGIIAFLIYGISLLSHYSRASDGQSLESNNFILQLDK